MIRLVPYGSTGRPKSARYLTAALLALVLATCCAASAPAATMDPTVGFKETVEKLAAFGDRSAGTPGNRSAAEYIRQHFADLGLARIGTHRFSLPVRHHRDSRLSLPARQLSVPIHPLQSNAISPGTIPEEGITGPLYYVGAGNLADFNGKPMDGAVVLMDLDSGRNWLNAASLGARALIYLDRGPTAKSFFQDKMELTPIDFPRFWMPLAQARKTFGALESAAGGLLADAVRMTSDVRWTTAVGENIYGLIPGNNETLAAQLIMVEAFYDSTARVLGQSPGADEACGIATLLDLARFLRTHPPDRSVLLVASSAHAQSLAGLRALFWAVKTRFQYLRADEKALKKAVRTNRDTLQVLDRVDFGHPDLALDGADSQALLYTALNDQIKTATDRISRRLMLLRLQGETKADTAAIGRLAEQRLVLRQLGWRSDYRNLSDPEHEAILKLLPEATARYRAMYNDAQAQLKQLKGDKAFRSLVKSADLAAVVSLHLSSHGSGLGAFNQGFLFPLKPQINRVAAYSIMDDVLRSGAENIQKTTGLPPLFKDTLRPSRLRTWQSYFIDNPPLGGEISALAGFHGLTLATTEDARAFWGTPYDRPETVDWESARAQSGFACRLIAHLADTPVLHEDIFPRDGFATVTGRANFLRHGELFADQPAPGSMILAYQGPGRYHEMVDTMGRFRIKGVADKKHVLHKVIIEGYKFDPATGAVIWAIDKKQTGKPAYRVKMQRRFMETDLVMFACRQSTLFDLLEPRSFRYMTKIQLIDGRREAPPLRYWWSRIDTRSSIIASMYMEPGSRLKMTLSDTILGKKLILTNATDDHPEGVGYPVDDYPTIGHTAYRVARDMWMLLKPRVVNLETHGIYNRRIRSLLDAGTDALDQAQTALAALEYDRFAEAAKKSWALASRVYDHVEKTQKDVLFGVLFYIALFVPFAFCMERVLFAFSDIYKRIIAFCAILVLVIAVIYHVHPAFELAYSPMVVVLAFFIMGLSLIVTLIIFLRFEDEMIRIQSRAQSVHTGEISRWKAFAASFFLGVTNLRRRRLRTALTCATLIILTFTIMSFTSVKSMRQHTRLLLGKYAPYQGILLKNVNWDDLPPEGVDIVSNAFEDRGIVAPRVWLEEEDRTRAAVIPVHYGERQLKARGLLGLSVQEPSVTGMDRILTGGRWFDATDRNAVLLPERMALNLGIDPGRPDDVVIGLWGMPFTVVGIFSEQRFMDSTDLDGEPLTPVTFPSETTMALTEVEIDALESGDEVKRYQSRYQHVDGGLTLIVPYPTLLAWGGHLKSIAVRPSSGGLDAAVTRRLVDRFGLTLFSGEPDGTFANDAGDTMNYSGVPNIIIPLVISVFIVLNTMIGSVYERKREIGIYTSVGLAPSHVSFLFIAEAMAFAVLSVVMGYLLAQTSASVFSGTRLWSGITVNYSSLSGVAAMCLVILVVMVSVIYPSKVAARIAIPDVNRSWTLPDPRQNSIQMTLPFLVKTREQQSCAGYLLSHFEGHQDISHGLFSTGEIVCRTILPETETGETTAPPMPQCRQITAQVWLAPFDFGIRQQVAVRFEPADEPGFLTIRILLIRQAGEANVWGRVNRAFMNDIRKQLLVWRSLDSATRQSYEKRLPG